MEEILNYISDRIGIISFLTGIIFTIAALILYCFPPKKINYLYGYRTPSSMKNQQVWDFSQKYSAIKMLQIGLLLIAVSFINVVITISEKQETILGIGLLIAGCIYMFMVTESAIKKNFPNH
ncbi:SdpI family protein [Flavobacterium sp.]|uniref:SdpI family protein n=1 Tax=Flavobacterium sp. TaxID=239 RepID=UPI0024898D4E|nr:SdpI family protein [Flavobacterium sp.]MDI1317564.1 SdpI family protein [Flavobacterium sp.]